MKDYIKVKTTWKLLLLVILLFSLFLEGSEPPLLKPKQRSRMAVVEDALGRFQLDLLILTPLGKEDFYEKRFSTFGGGVLFSITIMPVGNNVSLYGTLGFALTLSRLTLNQGENSFSSVYFQFPLLGKVAFLLAPELNLDLFLGAVLRTTRYDSRGTSDGGLQKTDSSQFFQPEAGIGLEYKVSSNLGIRLNISYLFLGLGVGLDL